MSERFRILLLEPSRYRAMMMQRTLARRFDGAIVVTFNDPAQALTELRRNGYAAAVVDTDMIEDDRGELVQALLAANPRLKLILLRSPETSRSLLNVPSDRTRCAWVAADGAPDSFADLIDAPISPPPGSVRSAPGVRPRHQSRLVPSGQ